MLVPLERHLPVGRALKQHQSLSIAATLSAQAKCNTTSEDMNQALNVFSSSASTNIFSPRHVQTHKESSDVLV